mmetsp:Transcript_5670/g.6403  ORF Transcript_5670/g.6403 Transcript_5670/m.6403 type:complete len:139 (-) Transcript_5670:24-440(-)|eukprot:CAMPEP_0205826698 /NCGR_PEP_ID=MMETSP0206-20130828/29577_1 /ASSEMBLY_ACC=CAM_ASM_000279 /TAXON_ID=36767 /ORGANISM="Euplotes focardii, Strain TN1" /LENGTH=138 /DNA_ID=CAMNT_0053126865 /DNA_START=383 /DNA_END=799 /DNA_ORIENTATION=+
MFHPDRFSASDDEEIESMSTTYSSFINNAYHILNDDLERAKYLLENKGFSVLEEDQHLADIDLLQHIMETREEIEFANTQAELDIHKQIAKKEKEDILSKISGYFGLKMYEDIKDQLVKLKYHYRILEAIDQKEREFI